MILDKQNQYFSARTFIEIEYAIANQHHRLQRTTERTCVEKVTRSDKIEIGSTR